MILNHGKMTGTPRALGSLAMSYGLQISASGVAAAMYRQDVLANNLANIDTVGFKPDIANARPRLAVAQEDGVKNLPSNQMLERLGGGVLMNRNLVDLAQGAVRTTSNPYDLALEGRGFFELADASAKAGSPPTLTRDGRFALNSAGQLVAASSGMPVLSETHNPITLQRGVAATISGDGVIHQAGKPVGQVAVMQVSDQTKIEKGGNGTMHAPAATVSSLPAPERKIRQYAVEESGVNQITTLMDLTSAAAEVAAHVSIMQAHDRMMDRAINSLGRVV